MTVHASDRFLQTYLQCRCYLRTIDHEIVSRRQHNPPLAFSHVDINDHGSIFTTRIFAVEIRDHTR